MLLVASKPRAPYFWLKVLKRAIFGPIEFPDQKGTDLEKSENAYISSQIVYSRLRVVFSEKNHLGVSNVRKWF